MYKALENGCEIIIWLESIGLALQNNQIVEF